MSSVVRVDGEQRMEGIENLNLHEDQKKVQNQPVIQETGFGSHGGVCAICLENIVLEETALVKGCEHVYCVTCILRWATYRQNPTCPQCKHPFEFLNVHRSLDGMIHDFMFEESVCLLLRATWFKPVVVDHQSLAFNDSEDYLHSYEYEDEDDNDLDEYYFQPSSSNIRIGNRRWGDNGYVRAGRREARPVSRSNSQSSSASSSRESKNKEVVTGRRAKRAQKRAAADKAAAMLQQEQQGTRRGCEGSSAI